jgi:hypothetical protein
MPYKASLFFYCECLILKICSVRVSELICVTVYTAAILVPVIMVEKEILLSIKALNLSLFCIHEAEILELIGDFIGSV